MKDLEQELRRVADDVIKLVAEKNAQYGDAYFKLREAIYLYEQLPEKNMDFEEAFPGVEVEEA